MLAQGDITPHDRLERALQCIAEREPEIQAWAHLDAEGARAQADALTVELEESGPRSPLHGVPCGIKDIFDVADMPCEWGSTAMKGRRPAKDCALAAELRRAGAVIVGKTVTTSFAYFDPGPTRNPRNLEHSPGGSSSGSAAAVAAGMVPFAVGSQTMGSVLRPASFCGVVGFKPTFGALPLDGVMSFSPSLDHAGLFTQTTEDMMELWSALRPTAPARPLRRIAALGWPPEDELDLEMALGFAAALERLRATGIEVVEYNAPAAFGMLAGIIPSLMAREAAGIHGKLLDRHGAALGSKLAELLEAGRRVTTAEYLSFIGVLDIARRAYASLTAEHPILATPAALGPAPLGLASTGSPRSNAPWTALGVPAICLPFGADGDGLPLGLQLTGVRGQESLVLATAARFEQILRPATAVIGSN